MFLIRRRNLNGWTENRHCLRARAAMDQEGPEWIDGVACCRECGEPIPQKRLDALPGVGLCRACQEERESGRA